MNKSLIIILFFKLPLFAATAQQAFDYFYPGQVSNFSYNTYGFNNTIYPYLQQFSGVQNPSAQGATFVCYDPIILLIMYYTQQNDIANLISILQSNSFKTRPKFITTYSEYLNITKKYPDKAVPVKSNLDSWIYAGQANTTNTAVLYPILILAQTEPAIQILLESGATPNFIGYSPALGNYPVKYFWQVTPFRCNSALLYAIQQNNINIAKILLQYGADPNLQNGGSVTSYYQNTTFTPYSYATYQNRHFINRFFSQRNKSTPMLSLIEKFGGGKTFSPQATSNLQEAIKSADIAKIQSTFEQNANINTPIVFENEEMSILQYIVLQPETYPKYDILNTLFNLTGIVINFKSSISGTTPLMAAICIKDTGKSASCTGCTGMTEIDAIIQLLIQNGADPFLTNSKGISPYQVISSKLNNMTNSDPEYNFLTQKLTLLINNMNYTLLTIGYYLYNLSLVSLAEKLNTNLTITQSRNISTVANTTQYQNLITSDKPTLENIITIIKSFPDEGNWSLMHTEVDILKTIILNYLKLGGSLGAQYNGDTILSAAQSTHNNHLIDWIKNNFGNILTFINAVNNNNIAQISASLADHVSVDTIINSNGDTALIYACSKNNINLATILLKTKANPNFENNLGQTPLSISIKNNNYNLTKLLLNHGANFNFKNKNGQTALSECIYNQNLDFINLLIAHKGNINIPINSNKDTALIFACRIDNNSLINILLQAKANTNVVNNSGETPLYIAINSNNYNLAELLLQNGANINFVYNSPNGKASLLTEFSLKNNTDAIKFLIINKVKISFPAYDNIIDFLLAIYKSDKTLFNALLSAAINGDETFSLLPGEQSNIWNISYNKTTLGNEFYLAFQSLAHHYVNRFMYYSLPRPVQSIVCNFNKRKSHDYYETVGISCPNQLSE